MKNPMCRDVPENYSQLIYNTRTTTYTDWNVWQHNEKTSSFYFRNKPVFINSYLLIKDNLYIKLTFTSKQIIHHMIDNTNIICYHKYWQKHND